MMKYILMLLLICVNFSYGYAQYNSNHNKFWAFGSHAGVDFTTGTPLGVYTSINILEGCGSVCDGSGNLMFYTDGKIVWDKTGTVMAHGSSIVPFSTYDAAQGAEIVPVIGNINQFYIFSSDVYTSGDLAYSIVDMSLNSGLGDVVVGSAGISLGHNFAEKMTTVAGDNCDIWVITHRRDSAVFWLYDITSSGISSPVVSNVGTFPHYNAGVVKVSPNREKIVVQVCEGSTQHGTELYDFNSSTGSVSNCQKIDSLDNNYGAEFSPDNTKLYSSTLTGTTIYQYDISLSSTTAIIGSMLSIGTSSSVGDMKLGPDGKIYVVRESSGYLGCISSPDSVGTLSGFINNAVTLTSGTTGKLGLPNVVISLTPTDTFYTSHDTTVCLVPGGVSISAHDSSTWADFLWSDSITTKSRTITSAGTYWVKIFYGCELVVDTIHVDTGIMPSVITGTSVVCPGGSATLSDSVSGGVWSASSAVAAVGSATGIYTGGSTSGMDTIKYTLASSGCFVTKAVTVNPLPSAITGAFTVCAGATTSLSSASIGGTWTCSGGGATGTISPVTGVLTGIAPGSTVVTYTLPTGCSVTAVVTVNLSPSAIAAPGGASMCVGNSIILTDPTAGGAWSGTTGYAIVGSTGGVTGIASGYSTVTYSIPSGCYVTQQVTVNALPAAITGIFSLCAGSTTTMYDAGGLWSSAGSSGILTIGSVSGVVTGVAAGTALVTYTLPTGCNTVASVTVQPIPGPITGRLAICVGDTATLRDSVPGGFWTSSDYSTANIDATLGTVTGISGGIAVISFILPSGCSVTAVETVNLTPGAISGVFSVCVGATTTLYGTGGGTWTSSDITKATINPSTGLLTGIAGGTATITYTGAGGCFVSQTVSVVPPASTIGGTLHVCVGSTTLLTDVTTGGTWSCAPSATAIISSSGLVSGISAGVAVVDYTTGGCAATAVVTVNPLPAGITGAGAVCSGSTTALSDAGGVWSATPATTGTISTGGVLTGISTGTVTVVYTLPTGCATSKIITVNALPSAISGPSSVCVGQTITETDGGGGTWSRSNTDANIGSASGIVTGVAAGPDIITYTLPLTGCYITKTVTVSTTAGSISGAGAVCIGSSITLTDGGAGTWSCSGAGTVGSSTGVVTGTGAGTAVVTYSIGTGCTASTTVTVNPLPATISGSGAVCSGNSLTLSGSTGGVWSCSGAGTVGSSSGVVTGTSGGVATISYTLPTGCYRTAMVTINPTPPLPGGPSALCVGAHITLTESGSGTWLSGSTGIATIGATTGNVTGITTGISNITFTSTAGCSITTTVTVSLSPTAITGPLTVCTGASVALTDTAGGGLWTSGSGIATIGSLSGTVTGVSAGTVVITYSLGTGCTVTRTETVTASPAAILGAATLCAGATIPLTETTTGGTWSSTPTSVATVSGGTVSGIAAGTAVIDYTGGGCFSSDTITVNATPAAISGAGAVCSGNSITLTDGTTGGVWSCSGAGGAIAIGSSTGIVTGVSAGTAIVTYSIGSCTVSKTITINPIATITGATGICVGNTTTLSDAVTGGTWSCSGAGVPIAIGSSTGVVTGLSAGVANITYTTTAGCKANYTVTVSTTPSTITGLLHVCIGGTTTLGNSAGGGTWTTTSSNITIGSTSSLSSCIVTGITAGTAPVTYSLGTGCTATTTVTVNVPPAPITGTMYMCPGATTSLADATTGGTWSAVSTHATVDSRGVVSGSSAGTATITYVPPTGCAITTEVTINPTPPTIGGTPTVCAGLTTTLTDASTGGTWSSTSIGATVDSATGIVTGISTGTAIITYTLPTGCAIATSVYVNAAPPAITGITAMCEGSGTLLSDGSPGGMWSTPTTGIILLGSAGSVTGIALGTALVSYTIGGCAAVITVSINSLPSPIVGNDHLCVGITDTLTDAGGGVWASSNPLIATIGSASGVVTSVIPGTVSISYSLGIGCTVSRPITVNSSPASITGPDNICMGSTTTLHDASTSGAWSSSDATTATVTSGGAVYGVRGGVAVIKYTIPTGCYARYPVGVIQVPAITGIHNICAWGDTMTVYDSLAGASWTSTLVTVSDSGAVLSYAPGMATITYTESHGCFVTATLTVNPLPAEISGNPRLCTGLTTTLYDSTAGGSWSSGAIAVATVIPGTGVVSGVTTGSSVITYTLPVTGCRQVLTVTVHPLPSPVSGTANVCAGAATTLTDTTSGGVWSSGSSTIASVTAAGGLVSGIAAGMANITYTVGASCTAVKQVTVNALPPVYTVTGGGSYCSSATGVHIGLSNSGTGINYQLYDGGIAVGVATAGTGHALDLGLLTAAGVYTVTAANSTTSCADNMAGSATITITPSVMPGINITASPGATLCAGVAANLSSLITNGGGTPQYQWTINGTAITGATNTTYSYTPANGDMITATLTSDAPCATPASVISNTVTMTVNPELIPVTVITASPGSPILIGETETFTATVTNGGTGITYQWKINGAAVPGATNASYVTSNISNGDTVTCIVTSGAPCGGNTASSNGVGITVVNNVGVKPLNSVGEVSLYPNPNSGMFTIKGPIENTNEEVNIVVTDLLGQQVYHSTTVVRNGMLNAEVQLGKSVANGMYLVSVHTAAGVMVFHVVLEQ